MDIRMQTRHLYEFGPFRVDATDRQLLRDGKNVPLPPKVFETLLVLVENSGRVLEKDELIRVLWPDSFVEESSLSQNIFQIRKALGEGASEQPYIETIPRRGYRFVASVREVWDDGAKALIEKSEQGDAQVSLWINGETQAAAPGPGQAVAAKSNGQVTGQSSEAVSAPDGTWRKYAAVVLATLIVAAGSFGVYRLFSQRHSANASAVPFHNMRITRLTRTGKVLFQAVSPDGKYVAHVVEEAGQQSLWVRQTATTSNVQIVPPEDVDYRGVTFSHDGNYVYYSVYLTRPNKLGILYQLPVLGGAPKKVAEDVDSSLTLSHDGKQIAFVRNYPFQQEVALIVVHTDGSGERRLAVRKRPNSFSFAGPSWSPDGKIIAVSGMNNDPNGNYMNVIGVRVADGAEIPVGTQQWTWVGQVAWMKDGSGLVAVAWHPNYSVYADQIWHISWPAGEARRITNDLDGYRGVSIADNASALTTIQSTRMSNIWIVPREKSGHAVQITSGFGDNYSENMGLAWLANNRIVYGGNTGGNTDLWVMDADGRNQRQLTTDGSSEILPTVSADGRLIVYTSYHSGIPHLWSIRPDGSNAKQLTDGQGETQPSLSPDGRWVVYTGSDEQRRSIWKIPVEGGTPVQLTEIESNHPVVSPDGRRVGCFVLDPQAKAQVKVMKLAVIPIDGGEPVVVCKGRLTADYGAVQWSPDGRALHFIMTINGVSNIWSQPIDGGQPRQVTDFRSDRIYRFAWSPDGKSLACERGSTINDIVLVTDFVQAK
ncbi:MAG TPA: winged helix-turn-helix domain-containing protein [Blastocatellia bacterium]|nr:winged helix-turn-helix domain-containing protein [Blastocatellia bacterium]